MNQFSCGFKVAKIKGNCKLKSGILVEYKVVESPTGGTHIRTKHNWQIDDVVDY